VRRGMFHLHQQLGPEDLERRLLFLYLLTVVGVLAWCAWHLLTALMYWGNLVTPAPIRLWPF